MNRKIKNKRVKKQYKYYFEPTEDFEWDSMLSEWNTDLNKTIWDAGYTSLK